MALTYRHLSVVWRCCFWGTEGEEDRKLWLKRLLAKAPFRVRAVLDTRYAGKLTSWLQQIQLAGTCYRFGAPLDLKFAKDFPIVPFNSIQGKEKPLANLTIRESLGNKL